MPGLSFVSEKYIEGVSSDEQLRGWCKFFEAGGVKEFPDNGVEEFALNYAQAKLKAEYKQVKRVDKMNYGYDLEITSLDGEIWHFEVKGQTSEKDVELTENETKAADKHRGDFFVCIVSSIPENPIMYEVRNPIYLGKKDKLTIPIDVWKKAGRKYV